MYENVEHHLLLFLEVQLWNFYRYSYNWLWMLLINVYHTLLIIVPIWMFLNTDADTYSIPPTRTRNLLEIGEIKIYESFIRQTEFYTGQWGRLLLTIFVILFKKGKNNYSRTSRLTNLLVYKKKKRTSNWLVLSLVGGK